MKKESPHIQITRIETKIPGQKESELREEAWNISKILLEAQESLKVLEYLIKDDPEFDVYNKHINLFWRHNMSVYSEHVLLKLNILFTPNEHFSVAGLLKKMKAYGVFQGIIPDMKILEWETKISSMNATYKKIGSRRNKAIAHVDRNPGKKAKADITLNELNNIVTIVQEIVKEIYWIVAETSFQIERPLTGSPVESLKEIIRILDISRRNELRLQFEAAREYGLNDQLPKSEQITNDAGPSRSTKSTHL